MPIALGIAVPLVSLLVGAWITYALNVRTGKRTRIADIYHDAIGAVTNVLASKDYLSGLGRWQGASDEDWHTFNSQLGHDALLRYVDAVAQARTTLARASAYAPELTPYVSGTRLSDPES
ncbi:MAG: hypothetical protein JWN95_1004 [Frankiales bacterium]|nr:hypothetical protein [Frankiales bacterium]